MRGESARSILRGAFIESPLSSPVCYKYLFTAAGAAAWCRAQVVKSQTEVHIINMHREKVLEFYEYLFLTY